MWAGINNGEQLELLWSMKKFDYVHFEPAFAELLSKVTVKPRVEKVPLDALVGRVLAEDLVSQQSVPRFDASHVDGYAVLASDTKLASTTKPVRLRVRGRVGPGERPTHVLGKGECLRILTGGFLPEGADAVIPQEEVEVTKQFILVSGPIERGLFVVPQGSDISSGEIVLRRGHIVRPQDVGLFSGLGLQRIRVVARPRVAIIPIGSELVREAENAPEGKVFSSHDVAVEHLVRQAGAVPIRCDIVPDDVEMIGRALRSASEDCSMVLTIGGSSVSEIDLVEESVRRSGNGAIVAHGIKVQPGRVTGFGVIGGKPIIFLPGLIQSTINAYVFVAYPLIRRLLSMEARRYAGVVSASLKTGVKFSRFVSFKKVTWVRLSREDGTLMAEPILGDSSHLSVIARANGYIVTPEDVSECAPRTSVDVFLVPGVSSLEGFPS